MLKRSVVLIIVIVFIVGAIPAYGAAQGKAAGEKSLFQIAKDTMDEPVKIAEKDRVKPMNLGKSFQEMSDYIKESSVKARKLSLRGSAEAIEGRKQIRRH